MKRFATAAIAAMTFIAPLGAAGAASAQDWRHDGRHDWQDQHHYNQGYRSGRMQQQRWDARRYNGYWHAGRFYYGAPRYNYSDIRYEYRPFRRGEYIPSYYRDRYYPVDYRAYRVSAPPRGYRYVRNRDNGELLLVGIASGVILGSILANN